MRGSLVTLGVISVSVVILLVCISFVSSSINRWSFSIVGLGSNVPFSVFVEGSVALSGVTGIFGDASFAVDASHRDSVILVSGGHRYCLSRVANSVVSAASVREYGGFWECVFLSLIILLLFVGWFLDFNLLGEVVVGSIIGLVWEVLTGGMWFYHGMMFIWLGIPVAVVLWWGFNLGLASFLAQLIFAYSGRNFSRDRASRILVYMMVVGVVCIPMEFLGWFVLDLWDYLWSPFWLVSLAWFLVGTGMLTAIDFLSSPFERAFSFFPVGG